MDASKAETLIIKEFDDIYQTLKKEMSLMKGEPSFEMVMVLGRLRQNIDKQRELSIIQREAITQAVNNAMREWWRR